jgi:hypothetical protein
MPEFAHAGIDDRIAGAAALPRLERCVVVAPGKCVKTRLQILRSEIRKMMQQVVGKFAPAKLAQELLDITRWRPLVGSEARRVENVDGADFAEAQAG